MKELSTLRSNILELLYKGTPETVLLNKIVKNAQDYAPDSICAILCIDEEGKHLLHGAAPNLPDFYNKAVHGIPVGFGIGSCGTAAYTGERVIVEDISTHPYWVEAKEIAQKANLASCWSQPIKDPSGKILGTFAIYHQSIHSPSTSDLRLILSLANLTAIVIDRCRMISRLEDSENKFKTLANASYEAVCILDEDKIIEVNQRAEKMTGYSEFELSNMSIYDFIPEENWDRQYNGKTKYHFETIGVKRDGTKINIIVNVKNSIFNNKSVSLLSINDITSLKQTETELKILSQSVIQSPVSVVVTDYDGKIEFVNPKFVKLSGYALHEVKGENPRLLSSGNTFTETYQDLWKTIKSGQEWKGELQNKKKNGELFWELASISALKNRQGEITHFIAVKEDITEQKRHQTIQQIILNISNAVFTHNTLFDFIEYIRLELGRLINTTNFFVALYDDTTETFHLPYMNDELDSIESFPKGKTISGWVVDHNTSLLADHQELKEMASRGEVELLGAPSKIWLGMPLKGPDKVIGVLAIQSYDDENTVTEKDKEVLELISHQISISIQKKRNEDNLHKALYQAKESDRLKSSFLATMSHELRTPLNAVLGFSQLVDLDTPIETAVDFCKTINQSGFQLLGLVEDLFDISSIESGNIKIECKDYPLAAILYEIKDLIKAEQYALNKTHLELKLVLPADASLYMINTDPKRFKQIFLNLLKNALKFTEKGQVEFGFYKDNNGSVSLVKFYVKDTGIGISDETQESIFDMFRQANETSSRKYDGMGIGLSISKKLVELIGGQISLTSKLNEGSTFYFTHPNVRIEQSALNAN
ncbi:PAS domain S-box protein [Ancylomarina euxinus]|uniref:histidine kinase n=1 Tax=Ancylomarina euxinus TaxID=2283627 RepID=A0A425Y2G4_9BACT|nr:PAS domain S-box protein [Ancylomarina euxinus]MCZ4694992.1 PAS domain S-box protein [Ancylomarina euxinus]MUP14857.1 PAS domain S-box protein [Ancylomarina euxinus]RRG22200.1 PAS domain S-box protein [Ancylomarina euxinus]